MLDYTKRILFFSRFITNLFKNNSRNLLDL